VGRALMTVAVAWARTRQFAELALNAPAPATALRAWYGRHGFRFVGVEQLAGRSYPSVVLSRALAARALAPAASLWPARHPAEMAALAQEGRARRRAALSSRPQDAAGTAPRAVGERAGPRLATEAHDPAMPAPDLGAPPSHRR
jgi:hypothetical protein